MTSWSGVYATATSPSSFFIRATLAPTYEASTSPAAPSCAPLHVWNIVAKVSALYQSNEQQNIAVSSRGNARQQDSAPCIPITQPQQPGLASMDNIHPGHDRVSKTRLDDKGEKKRRQGSENAEHAAPKRPKVSNQNISAQNESHAPAFLHDYSTGRPCLALHPFRLITTFLQVTLTLFTSII
ncbi:uncharacterized protein FTJAE_3050 [Fusarium tjaetaba]|uniref:Uncharacterized protein n=1 Tax=Fusarium tjaetaba TaxID=1567544 RepID=A0A8H5RZJ0_9HYPO|nr:uncharacterized protein FTJAE_3050 [Fusarium tjaetaba]KAF5643751.1 hypothetical protein FTJAE_3050 [Fusarium tjaetaba]